MTGLVLAVGSVPLQQAGAGHGDPPGWVGGGYPSGYDGPVQICHATNSNSNPYIVHTPNASGVEGNTNHFDHTGPVWDPTLKKLKITWGDIIPPVPPAHNGLNWTAAGEAIWHNGCRPVTTPAIEISKTPVNASVQPGAVIAYDIVVTAGGTASSTGVVVSDTLDSRYTWSENSTSCSIAGNVMTCNVGTLASGATFPVRVSATTASGVCTTVNNTASVEADGQGGDSDDTGNVITVNDGTNCTPGCQVNCSPPPPLTAPQLSASIKCAAGGQQVTIDNAGNGAGVATVSLDGVAVGDPVTVPAGGSKAVLVPVAEDAAYDITVSGVASFVGTRDCTEVAGVVVTPPAAPPAPPVTAGPASLPRTGATTVPMVQIGLGLVIMGLGAILFGREGTASII